MGTLDGRVSELEHGDEWAHGPVLIWIDGTDPIATDEIGEDGYPPRMWATRAAADRWHKQQEPHLPVTPEGEIAVVWLDFNGDKTPAEIRAGLQENTLRAEEHAAALAQQQRETREELEERHRATDLTD